MDSLRELELNAYSMVLKAFMAGPVDEWDKEEVVTKLREMWQIDHNTHLDVLKQLKTDPELQAIREGRAVRMSRGKSLKMGSLQTMPSLAAQHSLPGSGALTSQPSTQRRGPGRPAGTGGGLVRAASTRGQRPTRPKGGAAADPRGYLGRRCWRLWPGEDPPWVEGVVYEYDADNDCYTILYDPNSSEIDIPETMEANYAFGNPDEYVLCEKIDYMTMPGSRRQRDRPYPDFPPPPQPLPMPSGGPSKKRKSLSAPAPPVPQQAPFDPGYLASRLQLGAEEELLEMVGVLDRRERALEGELATLEAEGVSEADLAKRAELERQLAELGDKEFDLMAELGRLKDVEL